MVSTSTMSLNLDMNEDINIFAICIKTNSAEDSFYDNVWIGSSPLLGKHIAHSDRHVKTAVKLL
jgi:hypothetical protein